MRYRLLYILLLLPAVWAKAQVTYQKADSLTVCSLLAKANTKTSTLWFARQFLGVPYVAHTLELNDKEQLVVNTRELDCTTLVEPRSICLLIYRASSVDVSVSCWPSENTRSMGSIRIMVSICAPDFISSLRPLSVRIL